MPRINTGLLRLVRHVDGKKDVLHTAGCHTALMYLSQETLRVDGVNQSSLANNIFGLVALKPADKVPLKIVTLHRLATPARRRAASSTSAGPSMSGE